MAHADILATYSKSSFDDARWTRDIYRRGSGPAVIVVHEMPGLHPDVVRFGDSLVEAGLTVFLPSLFGEPGRPIGTPYMLGSMFKGVCIRREFSVWASDRSSPIVDWLRALARHAHAECGGPGVGAVGMCFTGGFALAMMTEPAVRAPVLSQPSLPFATSATARAAIDIAPAEFSCVKQRLADEDLSVLGLRFHGDPLVPPERFAALRAELGDRFEAIELDPADAKPDKRLKHPHSVLTVNLDTSDPGGATMRAQRRVIDFLHERLEVHA